MDLLGWKGVKNGDLLLKAEAHGFRLLITSDKNMPYQNSLAGRRLAVLILPETNWPRLRMVLGHIAAAAGSAPPGRFTQMPPIL